MEVKVATANMAGAARKQNPSRLKYEIIGDLLSDLDIIGLQEVVKVYGPDGEIVRDDIDKLLINTGQSMYQPFFFPYLDSTRQSHPVKCGSAIFQEYYEQRCRILEGTAILLNRKHIFCDFWDNERRGYYGLGDNISGCGLAEILPWYSDISGVTIYLGNRDTQPRSMIIVRVKLDHGKYILFCNVHLATLKEESREGNDKKPIRKPSPLGINIRAKQIAWVVQYIKSYQSARQVKEPIILVGDFNAEPGAVELMGLKQLDLRPINTSGVTHRTYNILMDLIFATSDIKDIDYNIVDLGPLEKILGNITDHNPVKAVLDL
ncbi:hypothetical protein FJZ33_12915 [Candidatus Poribacteria bacterium]|nr:hypothetical protein [Candidatus Poribacteria bacterium]